MIFAICSKNNDRYFHLGHFGRWPVRTSWLFVVLPSVAANYLGQGALIMKHPEAIDNPFYKAAPAWAQWPLTILATMATSMFVFLNKTKFLLCNFNIDSHRLSSNHNRSFFLDQSSMFSWLFATFSCYTYQQESNRSNLRSRKHHSAY